MAFFIKFVLNSGSNESLLAPRKNFLLTQKPDLFHYNSSAPKNTIFLKRSFLKAYFIGFSCFSIKKRPSNAGRQIQNLQHLNECRQMFFLFRPKRKEFSRGRAAEKFGEL